MYKRQVHRQVSCARLPCTTNKCADFREAGDKYETVYTHNGYNTYTMLKIRGVSRDDFGWYYCVANNSLGRTYYMMKLDGKYCNFAVST